MLATAFQAAQTLARRVEILNPCLEAGQLSYTAVLDDQTKTHELTWHRAVWHSAYCFSEELLNHTCEDDPVTTACRLDWQERVALDVCFVRDGELTYQYNEKLFTEKALPRNTVRLAQAIRAGYYMIEVPGEGVVVVSPTGHRHGVDTRRCSCSRGTGDCVHRLLFNAFIQRRRVFQELNNAYNREYEERLSLV